MSASTSRDVVLRVESLRLELADGTPIVEDVTLQLRRGEVLGLVGESGSGKTTAALSILGFAQPGIRRAHGSIEVGGKRLDSSSEARVRQVRGQLVSYVPQDPGSALDPTLRIGTAIEHMLRYRARRDAGAYDAAAALDRVHLPSAHEFRRRFPHQLSGGQQQRVTIAVALACEPPIVVLDEPTTGLDVITQARILGEVERLRDEHGLALVYVTHDLAVISRIADRIAVMYAGRIVEEGSSEQVLHEPRHPYTRGLITAVPSHKRPCHLRGLPGVAAGVGERPEGCAFAPRCLIAVDACRGGVPELREVGGPGRRVRCLRAEVTDQIGIRREARTPRASTGEPKLLELRGLTAEHRSRQGNVVVAQDVSFWVARAACTALVGESGSGKTTIARCVAGLHPPAAGTVALESHVLAALARDRSREERRRLQIVFQNPADGLNPRHHVRDQLVRPARLLRGLSKREADAAVADLLVRVRLPARLAQRFPAELSGGERQRVGIARALAANPDIIVCDEITSALDVSVQAAILELLSDLSTNLGVALLFITHDLGIVASIADHVVVLERGRICEEGAPARLLTTPSARYTQALVAAAPSLDL